MKYEVYFILHTYLPMKMEQSVPKRQHINFRRRGITQNKAYNNYTVCSECVPVGSLVQSAKRMRRVAGCGLSVSYHIFPHFTTKGTIFVNTLLNVKSTKFCLKYFSF